ncbi:hypothetical protein NDU88_005813 [Pleurodeles waltl]|uniref:Uncharacterized protein n=1 Tax=Pleurodeles waltl TaxID=8319 RepID=A0AAV7TVB9_PLEWA|nr:hypothetical protein NDU88_005813 [Pleurodeles waltl]
MRPHSRCGHYEIPAGAGFRPPAQRGSRPQHRSRLQMEPAMLQVCDRCSCTSRAFHCLLCGARDSPYRQPFPGDSNRQEKAGGRGTRNPLGSAASSATLAD